MPLSNAKTLKFRNVIQFIFKIAFRFFNFLLLKDSEN